MQRRRRTVAAAAVAAAAAAIWSIAEAKRRLHSPLVSADQPPLLVDGRRRSRSMLRAVRRLRGRVATAASGAPNLATKWRSLCASHVRGECFLELRAAADALKIAAWRRHSLANPMRRRVRVVGSDRQSRALLPPLSASSDDAADARREQRVRRPRRLHTMRNRRYDERVDSH